MKRKKRPTKDRDQWGTTAPTAPTSTRLASLPDGPEAEPLSLPTKDTLEDEISALKAQLRFMGAGHPARQQLAQRLHVLERTLEQLGETT
jgi:hypothetical protein